jgi:hypothetical protein
MGASGMRDGESRQISIQQKCQQSSLVENKKSAEVSLTQRKNAFILKAA